MKVFKYDTVKLILNTGKNVSTFTTMKIKYVTPSGIRGHWNSAAICPSDNTCIQKTVQFDEKGIWKVQAYVSKIGETYHGMYADVRVFDPVATTTTVPPTTVVPTT